MDFVKLTEIITLSYNIKKKILDLGLKDAIFETAFLTWASLMI